MKCVRTFDSNESAGAQRVRLSEAGIEAKILVDPLEGRFPALSHFRDVALMVGEEHVVRAGDILGAAPRRAG